MRQRFGIEQQRAGKVRIARGSDDFRTHQRDVLAADDRERAGGILYKSLHNIERRGIAALGRVQDFHVLTGSYVHQGPESLFGLIRESYRGLIELQTVMFVVE